MARRRRPVGRTDRTGGAVSWLREHRKALFGAASAAALVLFTAAVTPVFSHLADRMLALPSPAAAPSPTGELVVIAQWPPEGYLTCDSTVGAAGFTDADTPDTLAARANEDVRVAALRRPDNAVWYHGILDLVLTGADDTTTLILGIEPEVFTRREALPSWGLEISPGCGGPSQTRLLQSVLDRGTLQDLGLSMGGPDNPRAKAQPFGRTFTVSRDDPADVRMDVYGCEGLYEFGVKITYVQHGKTKTSWVGSRDEPLRIVGGWRGVKRYHSQFGDPVRKGPLPTYEGMPAYEQMPSPAVEICAPR